MGKKIETATKFQVKTYFSILCSFSLFLPLLISFSHLICLYFFNSSVCLNASLSLSLCVVLSHFVCIFSLYHRLFLYFCLCFPSEGREIAVGCVPKRLRSYIYCCHVKAFTHMQAQEKVEKVGPPITVSPILHNELKYRFSLFPYLKCVQPSIYKFTLLSLSSYYIFLVLK